MNDAFSRIKIRKLVAVYILSIVSLMLLSELSFFKNLGIDDVNVLTLTANIIFCAWFFYEIVKSKVNLRTLWSDFREQIKWKDIFKIVFTNAVLSYAFILLMLFAAFKINPEFFKRLLSEGDLDTSRNLATVFLEAIAAVLFAPVLEEIAFRGIILKRLRIRWGTNAAIILSSLLFALMHYQLSFFGALFFGVTASILYLKTGNLLVNISVHFVNNLLITAVSDALLFADSSSKDVSITSGEINIMGIIGVVMLIASGFLTIKYMIKNWPADGQLNETGAVMSSQETTL